MSEPGADRADFSAFYQNTLSQLRRYLMRMVGCKAEAEDLAQDAYVRVYAAMAKQNLQQPQAFLYTTARHLALDKIKRRRVEPRLGAEADDVEKAPSQTPSVQQVVMARQEWAQIERALADLPPGCRTVLLLRKIEQLSTDELAQRLGISRSTVEKQLARALRLLRASLQSAEAEREKPAQTTAENMAINLS